MNVKTLKESSDEQSWKLQKERIEWTLSPDRKPYGTGKQILVSTILLGQRELLLRYRGKEKRNEKKEEKKRKRKGRRREGGRKHSTPEHHKCPLS